MEYVVGEKVLDDWIVTRIIGEGSYGKVVEIERSEFGLNIKSALKIISIPQTESEIKMVASEGMDNKSVTSYFYGFVEEIIKEIAIMSELKGNTNIVTYEDHKVIPHADQIGWDILIRMELLTPLQEYVEQNEFTEEDIIRLGKDIARALELCQRYNIVHRDIKPENIFVSATGDFKLGDFGIARTVEKTTSGMSKKGTYTYMAPEIYEGRKSGFQVDMYSLGLVLYRLLNNSRMPFFPEYPQQITYMDRENALSRRMQGEKIPRPANGSAELANIVLKACEYCAEDRYLEVSDLRNALEDIDLKDKKVLNIQAKKEKENVCKSEKSEERTIGLFSSNYEKARIEKLEQEKAKQEREREQVQETEIKEEKKKKKILLPICMLAGMLVVGLICLVGFAATRTNVPDFSEMTSKRAEELADKYKLEVDIQEKYSETIGEGLVISQDIKAGTRVKKDTVVVLAVSKGIEQVEVPDFSGKTRQEAESLADANNLKLQVKEENSSDVELGKVISQNQEVGKKIDKDSTVLITVSMGKVQVAMPDFSGKTEEEVANICTENHIAYQKTEENSNEVETGVVISQSIAAGTMVDESSTVNVVISLGAKKAETHSTDSSQNTSAADSASIATQPSEAAQPAAEQSQEAAQNAEPETESVDIVFETD